MQYPLLLVAAFATASIAAPAAGPPASTQGKEDVAKEVGKLAEEACPPFQYFNINSVGYSLAPDDCKLLADECLQGGFTEPAELKKCIADAYIYGIKAEELVKEACPPFQLIRIDSLKYSLLQDACRLLADECLRGGITEPAELTKYITDARASKLDILKEPAQRTEKPAKAA
ncbi:hypothetical protein MHUMG1_00340 [Metarhizium humberi]|uniref:Secreted protein n=1 Tax=Metarhizium humberi TaxID=2596975 RepID=A0A9P8MLF8_9HYPO|nr:hypothetical protein MHUMG1_00340 [Metarhizium humberi]